MKYPMQVIDDICDLLVSLSEKKTAKQIGKIFNRERKWVYQHQNASSFVINADFVAGLDELGYQIILRKKEKNEN